MNDLLQSTFLRIAQAKDLLDDAAIEEIKGIQALDRMLGRERSVARICKRAGYLTIRQIKGILRGVRYYFARQADRRYGRIALRRGFTTRAALQEGLRRQKITLKRERVLVRLYRFLFEMGAISYEEHRVVLQALVAEGSRPRSPSGRIDRVRIDRPHEQERSAQEAHACASLDMSHR